MYVFDLFVSYSHHNKIELAIPIVNELLKKGVKVWFDKFEIRTGDSITDKINEGLRDARYGLILISPYYIKSNWARQELNAFFKKQITLQQKFILPIWYEISIADMFNYFPLLSDYRAIRIESDFNLDEVVSEILTVIWQKDKPLILKRQTDRDTASSQVMELHSIFIKNHQEKLRKLLVHANLEKVLQYLNLHYPEMGPEIRTVKQLSARLANLNRERQQGLITDENYRTIINQLILAIYQLSE